MHPMTTLFDQAQRYVGTPYLVGEFDCADLAARVQWEVFGRLVELPTHRKRPGGALGQAREIHRLQGNLADPVASPATGCAVLMHEPGPAAPIWHIGTVFMRDAQVWVLHNSFGLGSAALQRLEDLQRFGMRLDGFYAWRAAA